MSVLIRLDRLVMGSDHPFKTNDPRSLRRLAASLKHFGQRRPALVRWVEESDQWVLITGVLLWRAARLAGLEYLRCIVLDHAGNDTFICLLDHFHPELVLRLAEAQILDEVIAAGGPFFRRRGLRPSPCPPDPVQSRAGPGRPQMSIDRIREFWSRRPVRPFVLRTASGENHLVRHPEHLIIDAERGEVITADRRMDIIPISSIVEIGDA